MVKNFSVDWLAQSYHDSKQDLEPVETSQAPLKRHVPCLVQPRPPTSYDKVYIQPKLKCSRIEGNTSPEEQKDKEGIVFTHSTQRNCTSPSCKYLTVFCFCILLDPASYWELIMFCKSITKCSFFLSASENSGYSSGYESEAAASECPSIEDCSEGERDGGAQRRIRTKFTPEQIEKLEKIFSKHKYLDASERVKTAQKLNLSETQVRRKIQLHHQLSCSLLKLHDSYGYTICPCLIKILSLSDAGTDLVSESQDEVEAGGSRVES